MTHTVDSGVVVTHELADAPAVVVVVARCGGRRRTGRLPAVIVAAVHRPPHLVEKLLLRNATRRHLERRQGARGRGSGQPVSHWQAWRRGEVRVLMGRGRTERWLIGNKGATSTTITIRRRSQGYADYHSNRRLNRGTNL